MNKRTYRILTETTIYESAIIEAETLADAKLQAIEWSAHHNYLDNCNVTESSVEVIKHEIVKKGEKIKDEKITSPSS